MAVSHPFLSKWSTGGTHVPRGDRDEQAVGAASSITGTGPATFHCNPQRESHQDTDPRNVATTTTTSVDRHFFAESTSTASIRLYGLNGAHGRPRHRSSENREVAS